MVYFLRNPPTTTPPPPPTSSCLLSTGSNSSHTVSIKQRLLNIWQSGQINDAPRRTMTVFFYVFSACPQGTFKSSQGGGLCQQCPLNSRSTIEAATLCDCRNGYYRGDMDKPEDMCTSESLCVSILTGGDINIQSFIYSEPSCCGRQCYHGSEEF